MLKKLIIILVILGIIGGAAYVVTNAYSEVSRFKQALVKADGVTIRDMINYQSFETDLTKILVGEISKLNSEDLASSIPEIRDAKVQEIQKIVSETVGNARNPEFLKKIFTAHGFNNPGNYSTSMLDLNKFDLFNDVNKFHFVFVRSGLFSWRMSEINGPADKISDLFQNQLK